MSKIGTVAIVVVAMLTAIGPAAAAGLDDCFARAGQRYRIDPVLLRSIAQVETGYRSVINLNADGSEDIGMMQVNSWWLASLARYGISRSDLILNPCTNINVGAWILGQEIRTHGYNWQAIGAYNAKSPDKASTYAWKVWQVYQAQKTGWRQTPTADAAPVRDAVSPVKPKYRVVAIPQ